MTQTRHWRDCRSKRNLISATNAMRPFVIPLYNGFEVDEQGATSMSKERKPKKEAKKEPKLTPKERKAMKKSKKEAIQSRHR